MPHPNSWPLAEKLWELMSSWLSVSTLAMMKLVAYLPTGKIVFSAIFCRNSSAFDWARVSLECQTGQAYWRSGPGHITVQNKHTWARERIKTMHILTSEWKKSGAPDTSLSVDEREGTFLIFHPIYYILAPKLRLWRSTCSPLPLPPSKSWIHPVSVWT